MPKLEWVSVSERTQTTPEGINRLKQARPEITVDSDAVPGNPTDMPSPT